MYTKNYKLTQTSTDINSTKSKLVKTHNLGLFHKTQHYVETKQKLHELLGKGKSDIQFNHDLIPSLPYKTPNLDLKEQLFIDGIHRGNFTS